jgi:hypothetical protein
MKGARFVIVTRPTLSACLPLAAVWVDLAPHRRQHKNALPTKGRALQRRKS